jgi:hypothetical protein
MGREVMRVDTGSGSDCCGKAHPERRAPQMIRDGARLPRERRLRDVLLDIAFVIKFIMLAISGSKNFEKIGNTYHTRLAHTH